MYNKKKGLPLYQQNETIMKPIDKNPTIEKLEKSYRLDDGKLGSIPIAERNDCYFLEVEKETEKSVYFQFLGKMWWLPKSAFILSAYIEGVDYFAIKKIFYNQMLSQF